MSNQPVSVTLLNHVQNRLRAASFARALHCWTLGAFVLACATVLAVRLLGLLPEGRQPLVWLLAFPAVAAGAA